MAEHRKRLAGNFISLSMVQGLYILFPIITVPYLVRVLGVEGFGFFAIIQNALMYLDLLVSFGFGLTATQDISRNINDPDKTSEVIASVYIIKLILFAISVLIIFICCLFIPYLREHILIAFISPLFLLGNLLLPDWYFQGIQKMRNITIIAFISKIISLLLIILLVKQQTDISFAILALSAGNFIAGLAGLIILSRIVAFKIKIPSKQVLMLSFKESGYVFTSIILVPLYSSINLFILKFFTNPLIVGYYAIAEKVFSALGMLTSIANRTFYPHLAQLYQTSLSGYKKNISTVVKLFIAGFSLLAIMLFFGAETIIKFLAGKNNITDITYAVSILKIMCLALVFSPYVSFFFQLMIIQGQRKRSVINIVITILVNFINGCLLSWFFGGNGMAVSLSITILLLAFLNYYSFSKKLGSIQSP